jgi:GxxExxY protein
MHTDEHRCEPGLDELTEQIIGCAYTVSNTLGCGFLEKVYENALAIELRKAGMKAVQQHTIKVKYRGAIVGDYSADILVNESVLVELKAASGLEEIHSAQCLNYLKATGLRVCLLINFGKPKLQIKRLVL